ncbi:Myoclonin-1 [Intoshia linei]|uniref:Myoclonin-1 n=1 Tax=Intoshia linei TaxID=1819745 RepID=A0A177B4D9_9BILA|nr:Myoclonin-1 [Intoshia linei]
MSKIPFLPGTTFSDQLKKDYHVPQTLKFYNGYCFMDTPNKKIGNENLENQINDTNYDLTDKMPFSEIEKRVQVEPFIPEFVKLDNKVLRFYGWFKQSIVESPQETYQVRRVVLYYYLLDDTILIVEPCKENSGILQGKFVKRHKIPRHHENYTFWNWKQLNRGIDFSVYGKNIRLYDCDEFTLNFLTSKGLDLNLPEKCPDDVYHSNRSHLNDLQQTKTKNEVDKLWRFIELDRNVLRFYALWDESKKCLFGQKHYCIIHYYLVNNSVEVIEKHTPNDGRDPCSVLISRHKIPMDRYNIASTFPSIVLEYNEKEISQYIEPHLLKIGEIIKIYNREFFIYGMDQFTVNYYQNMYPSYETREINVIEKEAEPIKMEIPPYNNFGSYEDSMQSVVSIIPQPPKKNYVKMMENDIKKLRYEAKLITDNELFKPRRFIINYHLGTDMISIFEKPMRNSGMCAGMFLEMTRIPIPSSDVNNPTYYTPQDIYIGGKLRILSNVFEIINADLFVLNYIKENMNDFSESTIKGFELAINGKME